MSMITLNGVLVNVYRQPSRKDADTVLEKDKIQVLGDIPQSNGEVRKDLATITVPDASQYEGRIGEEISLPVGAFAPNKGTVIFFASKA